MIKLNVDFHSRVLLGFVCMLALFLGSSWIAMDFVARHLGDASAGMGSAPRDVSLAIVRRHLMLAGGLFAMVGLAASMVGARLLVRPMRALVDATRGIDSSKDRTDRKTRGEDDFAHVANALHGLTRNAHYDALTGLPNRTLFNALLDRGIERARRTKTQLALAFIDLDGFKKVNDTLGHEMGDLVLRKTADRLSRCIQPPSSISRLGGDEFVLILEGAGQTEALMVVERLMAAVCVPIRSPSGPIQVGMSTGIAVYPQVAVERDTLLKLADGAMYRSKARKCGPVVAKLGDVARESGADVPQRPTAPIGNSDGDGDTWTGKWVAPTGTGAMRIRALQAGSVDGRKAPIPANELERLTALRRLEILDKPRTPAFDRITQLAARSLNVPIALISIVDERRQWFMSRSGLDGTETSRDDSLCAHAIFARHPLVVTDATLDARFAENPLVTGEPHLRAYAGIPFYTHSGLALGALCVIDRKAREFNGEELEILRDLASMVEDLLQAREVRIASGRRPGKPVSL